MRTGPPFNVVKVGHCRYYALHGDVSAEARDQRLHILDICTQRLASASAHELRNIPFLMHRIGATQRSHFGRSLLRSLLSSISLEDLRNQEDQHGALRILFDSAQTAPTLRPQIVAKLRQFIEATVGPASHWDYAESCGLLHLLFSEPIEPALVPFMSMDEPELADWLKTVTPQESALAIVGATQVLGVSVDELPLPLVWRAVDQLREPRAAFELTDVLSVELEKILSTSADPDIIASVASTADANNTRADFADDELAILSVLEPEVLVEGSE